jgi:TorA maturation chaperone TorD
VTATVEAPGLAEAARLRLLALALAPPGKESLAEVEALAGALAERPGAPQELAELAHAAAGPAEEIALAHERLFAPDAVSPYEASIELDPFRQARQMADVAGFYGAFGAQAHGPAADRPDHAGTELEFLAFLALRRLQAGDTGENEEAERCAEIEASFLASHAGRWLPPFFRALEVAAEDVFHRTVGRLGAVVIEDEIVRRGLDVEQVAAVRGARLSVEEDEIECGAADLQTPFEAIASPHGRRRGRAPRV